MRRTLSNLAHIMGGEALLRVANFAVAIAIARLHGPAIFGIYATVLAYTTVAAMLADNGLQVVTVTEIAARPDCRSLIFSRVLVAKTTLFAAAFALLGAMAAVAQVSLETWIIGFFITARTVLQSYCQTNLSAMKALDRLSFVGPIQALHALVIAIGLFPIWVMHGQLVAVLVLLFVAQAVEFALESALLLTDCGLRLARVRMRDCLRLCIRSTSVGAIYTIAAALLRLDVVVLTFIAGAEVVGHFAAAQTVVTVVYVGSWLFGSVLLPELTRLASRTAELRAYLARWTRLICTISIPAALLCACSAPTLVPLLFGDSFAGSGVILSVLVAASPFILLNSVYLNGAIAAGRASRALGAYAIAGALALALDLALGRTYSGVGIAFAVLGREAVLFTALRMRTVVRA